VGVTALNKLSAKKENLDPGFLGENLDKLFAYIDKVPMAFLKRRPTPVTRLWALSKKTTKRSRSYRRLLVMMNNPPTSTQCLTDDQA
jgi:hypothetical protein